MQNNRKHLLSAWLILAITLISDHALADANSDAFTDGKDFGSTQSSAIKPTITPANASANVPGYAATSGESALFDNGNGVLTPAANSDVNHCNTTTSASDPNPAANGHCEGVRMITANPNAKASLFPIDRNTDPLVVQGNTVKSNPSIYTNGAFGGGAYSGCTSSNVSTGAVYEEEHCSEYLSVEDRQCAESLSVIVDKADSCVPGSYISSASYRARDDVNTIEVRCDFDPVNTGFRIKSYDTTNGTYGGGWRPFSLDMTTSSSGVSPQQGAERVGSWTVRHTTYASQGCNTVTNICSITFSLYATSTSCPNGTTGFFGGCAAYCTNGGSPLCGFGGCYCPYGGTTSTTPITTQTLLGKIPLSYSRPRTITTVTDNWDDQCYTYKARLP